jgi:hypothetical protein
MSCKLQLQLVILVLSVKCRYSWDILQPLVTFLLQQVVQEYDALSKVGSPFFSGGRSCRVAIFLLALAASLVGWPS